MSEPISSPRNPGPGFAESTLTPKSCAIAGFAFAVFSMLGQGTWSFAGQALLWNTSFAEGEFSQVLVGWAAATLVLAVVGMVLARRTLADPATTDSWEGHLARAAVIVAGAGLLLSLLGILAVLVRTQL